MLLQLERSIIQRWNDEIEADLSAAPFEGDERFSALSDADKESVTKHPQKPTERLLLPPLLPKSIFYFETRRRQCLCVKR